MIVPSIASANPLSYASEMERLGKYPTLHIDIEDGNFLPNITFGLKTVKAIRAARPDLSLNAHLMVTDPAAYLADLGTLGIREIALHLEAMPYPLACLNAARRLGMSPGLALNFATPVSHILPFVREIDFLLLMTAEPDDLGDRFHPSAPPRIAEARKILPSGKRIWVDGGVGENELPTVLDAGADVVIMGRAVFGASNPAEKLAALNAMFRTEVLHNGD